MHVGQSHGGTRRSSSSCLNQKASSEGLWRGPFCFSSPSGVWSRLQGGGAKAGPAERRQSPAGGQTGSTVRLAKQTARGGGEAGGAETAVRGEGGHEGEPEKEVRGDGGETGPSRQTGDGTGWREDPLGGESEGASISGRLHHLKTHLWFSATFRITELQTSVYELV